MIRHNNLTDILGRARQVPLTARAKMFWTLGNALMLIGVILLLYVGGLYADAEYGRYAARGDTDEPAPLPVSNINSSSEEPAPFVYVPDPSAYEQAPSVYEPAPFTAPQLNVSSQEGLVVGMVPSPAQIAHSSAISRVIIPSIGVDSKVVEVGWEVKQYQGQQVAVWQVAEYAVGQHRGSANPGEGENIVLAGHVGGYGKVFKDLISVKPGDHITIYSHGQQYLYTVQEYLLVQEEGVSPEQQAANARYIAPTAYETVTLVTCWPPSGPDKFKQRVIIRAVPYGAEAVRHTSGISSSTWR